MTVVTGLWTHQGRNERMGGRRSVVLFCVFVIALQPLASGAQGLNQCQWDLDRLGRLARQASSQASAAAAAQANFNNALADLKRCIDYPETFDLMRDGCRGKQATAETAAQSLKSALTSFNGALSAVGTSINSVNLSCGQGFNIPQVSWDQSPSTGGTIPTFPSSLSGKEVAALLAIGAVGAFVASGLGQDDGPKPLVFPNAPDSGPQARETVVETVTDGTKITAELTNGIPALTTVERSTLGDERINRLGALADTTNDLVQGFRWGKSTAPEGDELFGTTWYTILLSGGGTITLYAEPTGRITHRKRTWTR